MPAIIRQIPTSAMGIVGKGCSGAEALESAFTPPATDDEEEPAWLPLLLPSPPPPPLLEPPELLVPELEDVVGVPLEGSPCGQPPIGSGLVSRTHEPDPSVEISVKPVGGQFGGIIGTGFAPHASPVWVTESSFFAPLSMKIVSVPILVFGVIRAAVTVNWQIFPANRAAVVVDATGPQAVIIELFGPVRCVEYVPPVALIPVAVTSHVMDM